MTVLPILLLPLHAKGAEVGEEQLNPYPSWEAQGGTGYRAGLGC